MDKSVAKFIEPKYSLLSFAEKIVEGGVRQYKKFFDFIQFMHDLKRNKAEDMKDLIILTISRPFLPQQSGLWEIEALQILEEIDSKFYIEIDR